MRVINQVDTDTSNFDSSAKSFTPPNSDYTFVLDSSGIYFISSYFNKVEESYELLTGETYDDITYSSSFRLVFLYSSDRGVIDGYSLDATTIFFKQKITSIREVFGFDYIEFNEAADTLYAGNKETQTITSFSIPYIPYLQLYDQKGEDVTVIDNTCYLVGEGKLRAINIVTQEESSIKTYSDGEVPYIIESLQFDGNERLYIANQGDLGFEEYIIDSDSSVFYAQDLYDPVGIFIGSDQEIVAVFNTGEKEGDGGAVYMFTAEDDPSDSVGAIYTSDLYQGIYDFTFDSSRELFYSTNNDTDLVLVSTTVEGADPLSLIDVESKPTQIIYNPINQQILCLSNQETVSVIEEFQVVDSFKLPSDDISSINTDPTTGFLLASSESGEIYLLNPQGEHVGTIFPLVGKINNIVYFNIRGSELLAVGDEGATIISAPRESDQSFERDTAKSNLSLEAIDKNATTLESLDSGFLCVGYNDGSIQLLDSDSKEVLETFAHSNPVQKITTSENFFIVVSSDEVSFIDSDSKNRFNKEIRSETWKNLTAGKVKVSEEDGDLETLSCLATGNNYLLLIELDLNEEEVSDSEVSLSDELDRSVDLVAGTYIPRQESIPKDLEVRDSHALRKVNPDFDEDYVVAIYNDDGDYREIEFRSDGFIDEDSILEFVGDGSGFLKEVKGQFGKFDLFQDEADHRPYIAFNGELFKTSSGQVTFRFLGDEYFKIKSKEGLDLVDTIRFNTYLQFDNTDTSGQTVISKGNYFLQEVEGDLKWETRPGTATSWADLETLDGSPQSLSSYKGILYGVAPETNEVYGFDTRNWFLSAESEDIGEYPVATVTALDYLFIINQESHNVYQFDEDSYQKAGGFQGQVPWGVYVYDSKLYISSKETNEVYYYQDGWNFDDEVGETPTEFIDLNNELFVICEGENRVWVERNSVWQPTNEAGEKPIAVEVHDATLYQACYESKDVHKFSGSFSWERLAGLPEIDPKILTEINSRLFCTFDNAKSVQEYTSDGWSEFASSGEIGSNPRKLVYNDEYYLLCKGDNRIYKRESDGWGIYLSGSDLDVTIEDIEVFDSQLYLCGSGEIYAEDSDGDWNLKASASSGEIGSDVSALYVIDEDFWAISGSDLWQRESDESWTNFHSFEEDIVKVGFYDSKLIVASGDKIQQLDDDSWIELGSFEDSVIDFVSKDDKLYVVTSNDLHEYDGTWTNVHSIDDNSPISINVNPIDSEVWIVSDSDSLIKVYRDGNLITLGEIEHNPVDIVSFDGVLYCLTEQGYLYSFDSSRNEWKVINDSSLTDIGRGIVFSNRLVFSRPSVGDIYQYDGSDLSQLASVDGNNPLDLVVFDDDLYVICEGSNDLHKLSDDESEFSNLADLGIDPKRITSFEDNLIISCTETNDLLVWDGDESSRLNEVGYNPYFGIDDDDRLLVVCNGLGSVGEGVFAFAEGTWSYQGSLGEGASDFITYKSDLYVACKDSNEVYKLDRDKDEWDVIGSSSDGEIGEGPLSMEVFEEELYLVCESSNNTYKYNPDDGWDLQAIDFDTPRYIVEFDGLLYLVEKEGKVLTSEGGGWSDDNEIEGSDISGFINFSSRLHALDAESNKAFIFPSYLLGSEVSTSLDDNDDFITISAEFGEEVRLLKEDDLESEDLPDEDVGDNEFDLLVGVGFDFSPKGEVSIRSDNFEGQISEIHISASKSLRETDQFQSYLFGFHNLSEKYIVYDKEEDEVLLVNQSLELESHSFPISDLNQLLYDSRSSSLFAINPSSINYLSLNNRILGSGEIEEVKSLDYSQDFTIFYNFPYYYFVGQNTYALVAPLYQALSSTTEETFGLEPTTSYIANLNQTSYNLDRLLINLFNPKFSFNSEYYFLLEGSEVDVRTQEWEEESEQTLGIGEVTNAFYLSATQENNLPRDQIYLYDDEDITVYEINDTSLNQLKQYSDKSGFNSPLLVEPKNEIWFIEDGTLRSIKADEDNLDSTNVSIVEDNPLSYSDEDNLSYDFTRSLVVVTNQENRTVNEYTLNGRLVNQYSIDQKPYEFIKSGFAFERIPIDVAVSRVDGLIYVLASQTSKSQRDSNEVIIVSGGVVVGQVALSSDLGEPQQLLYSQEASALLVETDIYIIEVIDRQVSRIILKDGLDNSLTDNLELIETLEPEDEEWTPLDLGEDLDFWFDAQAIASIERDDKGILRWTDRQGEVKLIQSEDSKKPVIYDIGEVQFEEGQSLELESGDYSGDYLSLAFEIENDGNPQTILDSNKYKLDYRDEELSYTLKGEVKGFYPIEGTQGSPRGMARFNGTYYLSVSDKDEVWKYDYSISEGSPSSLPKWVVEQKDDDLQEPEYLYEFNDKLWCCYALSNTIATVESKEDREIHTFDSDKIRPRRMIEYDSDLYVAFQASDHIGRYQPDKDEWTFYSVGRKPYGMAVFDDKLLVACSGSDEIWAWDKSDWSVFASDSDLGEEAEPQGLFVFNDTLFVACAGNDEIIRYTSDDGWSTDETVRGYPFNFTRFQGDLYVCTYESNSIWKLTDFDNGTWSKQDTVAEGLFDLFGLDKPDDIDTDENTRSDGIFALCDKDISGRVYFSDDGSSFSSLGRSVSSIATEFNEALFTTEDEKVYYFDGLHFHLTLETNTKNNDFKTGIDSLTINDGKLYVGHRQGTIYESSDGLNWTVIIGFEEDETEIRSSAKVVEDLFVSNDEKLFKLEGDLWKRIDTPINGDIRNLNSFESNGVTYLLLSTWNESQDTKLWAFNPTDEAWYSLYSESGEGEILGNSFIENGYLYIAVKIDDYKVYRGDISNYDPSTQESLNWERIGTSDTFDIVRALAVLDDTLYAGGVNDNEIYEFDLTEDFSNSWSLSGSLGSRIVDFSILDNTLYSLHKDSGDTVIDLYKKTSDSWEKIIDQEDIGDTYFFPRSPNGLVTFDNRLLLWGTSDNSNGGVWEVDLDNNTFKKYIEGWGYSPFSGLLSTTNELIITLGVGDALGDSTPAFVLSYNKDTQIIKPLGNRRAPHLYSINNTLYQRQWRYPDISDTDYYQVPQYFSKLETNSDGHQVWTPVSSLDGFHGLDSDPTIEDVIPNFNGDTYLYTSEDKIYRWDLSNSPTEMTTISDIIHFDFLEIDGTTNLVAFRSDGEVWTTIDGDDWSQLLGSSGSTDSVSVINNTAYRKNGGDFERLNVEDEIWSEEEVYEFGGSSLVGINDSELYQGTGNFVNEQGERTLSSSSPIVDERGLTFAGFYVDERLSSVGGLDYHFIVEGSLEDFDQIYFNPQGLISPSLDNLTLGDSMKGKVSLLLTNKKLG